MKKPKRTSPDSRIIPQQRGLDEGIAGLAVWLCIPVEELYPLFFSFFVGPTWLCRFVNSVIHRVWCQSVFYRPGEYRRCLETPAGKDVEALGPTGLGNFLLRWACSWGMRMPQFESKPSLNIAFPVARRDSLLWMGLGISVITSRIILKQFGLLFHIFLGKAFLFNYIDDND